MDDLLQIHRIASYECSDDSLMKPECYMLLCQEIAEEHAQRNGFGYDWGRKHGLIWVEAQGTFELLRRPRWKETVTLRTNTGRASALQARRFVEMQDETGAILARADLMWVLIDVNSRRPVPLKRVPFAVNTPCEPTIAERTVPPFPEHPAATACFTAGRRDVDFNGHINNSAYLTWSLDTLPSAAQPGSIPVYYHIRFRKESMQGEELQIEHYGASQATKHIISCGDQARAEVHIFWE